MLKEIVKKLKSTLTKLVKTRWVAPLGIGILIFTLFIIRDCRVYTDPVITPVIAEETYRPPIVKLPFTKDKQPIKSTELPIPAELVDKTFEFSIAPSASETGFFLVLGRDGKVYGTLPDNVSVTVTKWKKKFIRFTLRPAYSMVYSDGFYHCISLDIIAINKFSVGVDMGTNKDFDKYLAGISARIRMADIDTFIKKKLGFLALAGWDGFSKRELNYRWAVGFLCYYWSHNWVCIYPAISYNKECEY